MEYKVVISDFEGPLDLLLHLIKESSIEIFDISIEQITDQYLDYIEKMEVMNLDIASEYLTMAAELIEMKSRYLLPNTISKEESQLEEDPKEAFIARLLEYQKYKEITPQLQELEEQRQAFYSREAESLKEYQVKTEEIELDITLDQLLEAFRKLLERKELDRPLQTKITTREYSVHERSSEIQAILRKRKKIAFQDLFEIVTKEYVIVTFLSILELARKQELFIVQDSHFEQIMLEARGGEDHE